MNAADGNALIPGPDPGACPDCGGWRKAGMIHQCECESCGGTGNWTGWSGDDEHTQEQGCPECDGTGLPAGRPGR